MPDQNKTSNQSRASRNENMDQSPNNIALNSFMAFCVCSLCRASKSFIIWATTTASRFLRPLAADVLASTTCGAPEFLTWAADVSADVLAPTLTPAEDSLAPFLAEAVPTRSDVFGLLAFTAKEFQHVFNFHVKVHQRGDEEINE